MGECGCDFVWGDMVVCHLSRCRLQRASLPSSTACTASRGVAAASLVAGRRGARGVERQQIKWLLYVGPIFFVASGLHIGFYFFWLAERSWGLLASYLLVAVGGLSGPSVIDVAKVPYRLYEIDLITNTALVSG